MASYTVTGVNPVSSIPGVPSEVKNVPDERAALAACQDLAKRGLIDIEIIQHNGPKISLGELEKRVSGS